MVNFFYHFEGDNLWQRESRKWFFGTFHRLYQIWLSQISCIPSVNKPKLKLAGKNGKGVHNILNIDLINLCTRTGWGGITQITLLSECTWTLQPMSFRSLSQKWQFTKLITLILTDRQTKWLLPDWLCDCQDLQTVVFNCKCQ